MHTFNKSTDRKANRKKRLSEENTQLVRDRIWRQLKHNVSGQTRLSKHVTMKNTIKR